jgi:4-hydroxythreonine-4-phosphate dehydrogenase
MGDPGGIGPEICVKTLADKDIYEICRPLLIGDAEVIENAVRFCGLNLEIQRLREPETGSFIFGTMDILDLANMPLSELAHKKVTARQGRASVEYIFKAIELALQRRIDGTVTGPINKAAVNAAGYHYAGHTEIYAEKTGSKDYAMMLADGDFRVVHVSTHVSLKEACDLVTRNRVERVIRLANDALVRLGVKNPRVGVAGLNPHCGEDGMFGHEDETEIRPAVEAARHHGIAAEGPIPADTVFSKMKGAMYDVVVVMYHDQGHIPTKIVGFHYDDATGDWGKMGGVNITLGLPIVRTSVDHGTAFGKAGEGRANPQSMMEAIRLAARLASVP